MKKLSKLLLILTCCSLLFNTIGIYDEYGIVPLRHHEEEIIDD